MFNRKITPETFDDAIEDWDLNQDSSSPNDILTKSTHPLNNAVNLETGEVYTPPNDKQTSSQIPKHTANFRGSKTSAKIVTTPEPSSPFKETRLLLGVCLVVCIAIGFGSYLICHQEILKIQGQISVSAKHIENLKTLLSDLENNANGEDYSEIFSEIDTLTQDLENLQDRFTAHQDQQKPSRNQAVLSKPNPWDPIKDLEYLGMFGTENKPFAILKFAKQTRQMQVGQVLIESWTISHIDRHQLMLSHPSGSHKSFSRKSPSF